MDSLSYLGNFEDNDQENLQFGYLPIPELNYLTSEEFVKQMSDLDVYLFEDGSGLTTMDYLDDLKEEYDDLRRAFNRRYKEILKKRREWCDTIDNWEFDNYGRADVKKIKEVFENRRNEIYVEAQLKFGEKF